MATKLGSNEQQEFDPKYEWQENAANFLLKLHLAGFRKEDFRVQVDGAGRLTVRGQRADGNKHVRIHKVFQLPPTSNLEDISGRFDAGVLSLTVPKRPAASLPAAIEDIISKRPTTTKEEDMDKPKEDVKKAEQEQNKEETKKKPQQEEAKKKAEDKEKPQQVDAKKKMEQEQKTEPKGSKAEQQQKTAAPPKSPETKPPQAADKEEEKAKVAAAAAAEEAERQRKKQISAGGGWKERVAEELQGLASSEWAEGVVETVKKNKEVIAVAVAAFSLGLFVSSKLCSRNN